MPGPPNPVEKTYGQSSARVSKKRFVIAGIECNVFGLEELGPQTTRVACLWLLNPRLMSQETMAPLAHHLVASCSPAGKAAAAAAGSAGAVGLIAVTFDQRNHGGRQVDAKANEAWRQGNGLHAQDMFSIYHGTQLDLSQLITYLPSYAFPRGDRRVLGGAHVALGVSLGGHCVWHCLLHEPRVATGVVVVGCPDYLSLMTDRARLSKLDSWTRSDPPGAAFVGSEDFPATLLDAVDMYDPAGLLQRRTMPTQQADVIGHKLGGKRILNLSGGSDKLVPYAAGEPFLKWFKSMIGPDGSASEHRVLLVDNVYEGIGHDMSPEMVADAVEFISESLRKAAGSSEDGPKL